MSAETYTDFYTLKAAEHFGITPEEVTPEQRDMAKALFWSLPYAILSEKLRKALESK